MIKTVEDKARSISKRLSNLAQKLGVTFQDVSTEFLLERMVVRLLRDEKLASHLVFKGGYVALRAYNSPRFTVDVDSVMKRGKLETGVKKAIAAIETDIKDGVWFQVEKSLDLKTQGEYGGHRVVFRTGIGPVLKDIRRAQLVNLDIGVGDPIVPAPLKLTIPEMLGEGSISWNIYPIETAAAEKLQTLIVRGSDNSRSRDIFDLFHFLPRCDATTLKQALKQTFAYRGSSLPEDLPKVLKKIDLSLIKRGWSGAIQGIDNPPSFEGAFEKIISETTRLMT